MTLSSSSFSQRPVSRLALMIAAGAALLSPSGFAAEASLLTLNAREYLEKPGVNVMLAHDFYPESHQGGVGIIQNGLRVATNGDLRLEPTPGQWQPTPAVGKREIDRATGEISVHMRYPDESKNRKGFNPIGYPDLTLGYRVKVLPAANGGVRIVVDLDAPLPPAWVGKVGFNFELYPGILFGKAYTFGDDQFGTFPRQANGPGATTAGDYQLAPLGRGPRLIVAPESERQRMTIEAVKGGPLELLDGRAQHTNGWFVVRALVPADATTGAIEWLVTPHAIPGWRAEPVIQVSQVGYHPKQPKVAVIELDPHDDKLQPVSLFRTTSGGELETVTTRPAKDWGAFLRSRYLHFDFSEIEQPGLYVVGYGTQRSAAFQIGGGVFQRHVWQPTVEYFLPAQMCHMRVRDRYRVWHGLCHADDALMAPVNHNHFDGYVQGPSTLTSYQPGQHVPGLNVGGWHDAGDYDLRIESQAETIHGLALAWELFQPKLDNTTVNQGDRLVEIHQPDGKPDILQQIEHGALSIVGGYRALGRLYRGLQDPTLFQYTHLGDAATTTDNVIFKPADPRVFAGLAKSAVDGSQAQPDTGAPAIGLAGAPDDRWVFTEENPRRELGAAAGLAAAARALKGFNDPLAADCLRIAGEVWARAGTPPSALLRLEAAIDLYQSTGDRKYADAITALADEIVARPDRAAWLGARSLALIQDPVYTEKIKGALRAYRATVETLEKETPYGLPYKPDIWGAGWSIQRFGVEQYFLHRGAPEIFPATYMLHAVNFVLGCHPGPNNASFVSGVGAKSNTTAYGTNRADWSYIPGGISSGTALIRPDFPEMLEWPFLWQQGEYCLGNATTDYIFLVLAADHLLNR